MLITHDMGVVANRLDDVAVMYMGNIVEAGTVVRRSSVVRSIPIRGRSCLRWSSVAVAVRPSRLSRVDPDPFDRPKGCQFAPRCPY